jgi:hypothetical protein
MMSPLLLKAAPYGIAVLLAGGWWIGHNRAEREKGALRERLRVTDSSLAVAVKRAPRIDSIVKVDTVKLRRVETRTITLLDTLLHSDTVVLTKRESVLVFVADSLVRQCRATVDALTDQCANLRERLRLTEIQRDSYRRLVPSGFSTNAKLGTAVAVGLALCKWLLCPKPE